MFGGKGTAFLEKSIKKSAKNDIFLGCSEFYVYFCTPKCENNNNKSTIKQ